MGIRINKIMGWGLNDLGFHPEEEHKILDPRIIPDEELEIVREKSIKDFYKWLKENREEAESVVMQVDNRSSDSDDPFNRKSHDIAVLLNWDQKPTYYNFSHDGEMGDPKTIIFPPITDYEKHKRYGDLLDSYEHEYRIGKNTDPEVIMMDNSCGIYPHVGARRKPGTEPIEVDSHVFIYETIKDGKLPDWISPASWSQLTGRWAEGRPPSGGHEIATMVNERYRPEIPGSLIAYIYWLGLFTDFHSTIQDLRPMLYTYWS